MEYDDTDDDRESVGDDEDVEDDDIEPLWCGMARRPNSSRPDSSKSAIPATALRAASSNSSPCSFSVSSLLLVIPLPPKPLPPLVDFFGIGRYCLLSWSSSAVEDE